MIKKYQNAKAKVKLRFLDFNTVVNFNQNSVASCHSLICTYLRESHSVKRPNIHCHLKIFREITLQYDLSVNETAVSTKFLPKNGNNKIL